MYLSDILIKFRQWYVHDKDSIFLDLGNIYKGLIWNFDFFLFSSLNAVGYSRLDFRASVGLHLVAEAEKQHL